MQSPGLVASAPEPASSPDLGADGPARSAMAPCCPDHASLAERPVRRPYPRQEPSAGSSARWNRPGNSPARAVPTGKSFPTWTCGSSSTRSLGPHHRGRRGQYRFALVILYVKRWLAARSGCRRNAGERDRELRRDLRSVPYSPTCSCITRSTCGWPGNSRPVLLSAMPMMRSCTACPWPGPGSCWTGRGAGWSRSASADPEKTRIVYCKDGKRRGSHEHTEFTFLGFTFRARGVRAETGTCSPGSSRRPARTPSRR